MKCPECGAEMILRETKKFKTNLGQPQKFYGCERFPVCRGTHGAHPNGKPLGTPGDRETKRWRGMAHKMLDEKFEDITRKNRYKKLQAIMGLVEEDAHIAKFDISQCKRLIKLLSETPTDGEEAGSEDDFCDECRGVSSHQRTCPHYVDDDPYSA